MRIAYICADPGVPVFGQKGCSIHVQEMIRAFQHKGATVDLFAVRLGDTPPADLEGVTVHRLPAIPKLEPGIREKVAFAINPDLQVELDLSGPFDVVYERYSLWSYGALEWAQSAGIPGLLEVNAPLIEEQAQHRDLVHRPLAEQVASRVFRAASGLIAVSQGVKHYLERWVNANKIHVISNGVNPRRFLAPIQPAFPRTGQHFTVGFVGSLKPWHGVNHLVHAFARLHQRVPQARLLVVGDGPERAALEMALQQHGLGSAASLVGAVPPDQIPRFLAAMDVAVAPYPPHTDFYFSPLKVVEYMAAGLPVVVSHIGQLAELVTPHVTGLLCPPGDDVALAEALEQLWRSPALRYRLGQAARQHMLTHHTWEAIAYRVLAIAQQTPTTHFPV